MSEILSKEDLDVQLGIAWDDDYRPAQQRAALQAIRASHEALRKRDKRRLELLQFVRDWLASKPRELIERIDAELKETAA